MEADSSLLIYYIFVLAVLLIFSAIFSSSETALFSVNRIKLEHLVTKGDKRAVRVYSLLKEPSNLIATILICNEIVNIAISSIFTVMFIKFFGKDRFFFSIPVTFIFLLTFGEIIPKTLAVKFSDRYAMQMAPIVKVLWKLVSPLRVSLVTAARIVLKPFKVDLVDRAKTISEEEFMMLIEESEKGGVIEEEEKEIIDKALELGETMAKEIMTPVEKVVALNEKASVKEAIKLFDRYKFSRMPVYGRDINEIKGILHIKRVVPAKFSGNGMNSSVREFMNSPFFIHEKEKIDTLLKKMQKRKKHMAIVVDFQGKTRGVITMDDITTFLTGVPKQKSVRMS